nr:unnamed protein product [uncultured bacterium]
MRLCGCLAKVCRETSNKKETPVSPPVGETGVSCVVPLCNLCCALCRCEACLARSVALLPCCPYFPGAGCGAGCPGSWGAGAVVLMSLTMSSADFVEGVAKKLLLTESTTSSPASVHVAFSTKSATASLRAETSRTGRRPRYHTLAIPWASAPPNLSMPAFGVLQFLHVGSR